MSSIKRNVRTAGALMTLALCSAARAQDMMPDDPLKLAGQQNCLSCHSVARNFMGPSFRNVAAKYAGVEGARVQLAHKIVEGGVGVWGIVPMPANTQLSPDQAAALADWILSLK